jgi:DNA-binding XRE family transcriptional regulator
MSRPTFEQFKKKALADKGVMAEYEALAPAFEMKRRMIAMRKAKGLTQEDMANILGTRKSNISRLESLSSDISPTFATVEKYALALGYTVKVDFEPLPA